LEKFLTKELSSKSEFELTVCADTYKMNIDNMGGGKMCLSHIASPKVKYEDQEFTDPITKDKTPY
jgi:hypothetical protein